MMNVIFLDCDGVLNKQFAKDKDYSQNDRFGLCKELVNNLKFIIDSVENVKIAISSSWRNFRIHEQVSADVNWRNVLCNMLGCSQDVIYGDIPTANEFSSSGAEGRVADIRAWLNSHLDKGIGTFVIIDDECSALHKAFPNNVVDCEASTFNGLTHAKAKEAIWILTHEGKEHKAMEAENTWFISDSHFFHNNIIKYCNRPFKSVEEMNMKMIESWNSVVKKNDIVWHLGDFALGPNQKKTIPELVSKLNGRINLVLGNHDHNAVKFYYDAGFHRVYDRKVIINDFVILSHAPLMFNNENCPFFNIYGHVHDSEMYKTFTKTSCCACVERHDYKPISWKTIQDKCNELNSISEN